VSTEPVDDADAAAPVEPTLAPLDHVTGFRLRRLHGLFVAHWAMWFLPALFVWRLHLWLFGVPVIP
jgi:hypothetical protein